MQHLRYYYIIPQSVHPPLQFSLISDDGSLDYSAIDSSYSRLRTTICDIVQDSILESSTTEDAEATNTTANTDTTLEDDDEARMGGLFTQTYRYHTLKVRWRVLKLVLKLSSY